MSQRRVTPITASMYAGAENRICEALMPILMLALIALGTFGLIGLLLVLAVSLEQKKVANPGTHGRKTA